MRISVIMPSFNQAPFVAEAIESVLNQCHNDTELIFVDGGSNDGTLEIAASYAKRLAQFISEPDEGQSHALEKGFALATGEILTWLNTDDLLLPGVLSEVAALFADDPACEWAFGNVVWIDTHGKILDLRKGERDHRFTRRFGILSACGPSAFFTPRLLDRAGGIDRKLHYKMDTDLWYRFRLLDQRYRRLKRYGWALRLHENAKVGGQATGSPAAERHRAKIAREDAILAERYFGQTNGRRMSGTKAAAAGGKLMSPQWLQGRRDAARWRGRSIIELCEYQRQLP